MADLQIPKVGDRVNIVLPEQYENAIRPADVIEVQNDELGVIAVKVIGDFKDENGKPKELVIRNSPPCSVESLKKKVRGNTWHWPKEKKGKEKDEEAK